MQFSIHRIWLLIRKQWTENKQFYFLGLLAIAGIISATIIFDIAGATGFDLPEQENILIVGILGAGFVFTTTILGQFNQKTTSINTLMLPASAAEKLAVAAIYSMILFPVFLFSVSYPLIIIGHYAEHSITGRPNLLLHLSLNKSFFEFSLTFLALQSCALLSSLLFKRYVLIKGAILVIAVFFGANLLNPLLAKSLIKTNSFIPVNGIIKETYRDNKDNILQSKIVKEPVYTSIWSATPYSDIQISNWIFNNKKLNGKRYSNSFTLISNPYNNIFFFLYLLSIPFLWVITWFKLKEKEL